MIFVCQNLGRRTEWFLQDTRVDGVFKIQGLVYHECRFLKQVMKRKGTFRLSIRDIFWSQQAKRTIKYSNVDAAFQQRRDSDRCPSDSLIALIKEKQEMFPKEKLEQRMMKSVNTGE